MPVKIFFCYAHEDEALLNKLKSHLSPLQRQGLIDTWHDRDISAGTEWEREIDNHLNFADIILVLVSPDFIASDYCYGIEMKRAMQRHERGETRTIPVILRHTYWQGEPLGKLQVLPIDGKPITSASWHNLDEAFFDVVKSIRKVIEELSISEQLPQISSSEYNDKVGKPARDSKFYYCYISEAKINQILFESRLDTTDAVIDAAEKFKKGHGNLSVTINDMFEDGGDYGKPQTLHYSHERSKILVPKLHAALLCLEKKYRDITWLIEAINKKQHITPGVYLYYGDCWISRYDEEFGYFESALPPQITLTLSCSLRYFSDVLNKDGKIVLHSGNVMFFSGAISSKFQSLLYVLQAKNNKILGTPLFLGLPLESSLEL